MPDRLQVETATGSLSRMVSVWDEQPGSADRRIAQGRCIAWPAASGCRTCACGCGPPGATSSEWRSRTGTARPSRSCTSPPSSAGRCWCSSFRPTGRGEVTGTLRFGGGRARRPRYDLTALRLGAGRLLEGLPAEAAILIHDAAEIPFAVLGELRANPFFDATPALAFAMHPGASIDKRIFSHRRPISIAPSAEGLSRLRLSPEDTARARADLADLRVVDGDSRQWPYLMRRDARSQSVSLEIEETESRKRRSRYRLGLPVAPLRLNRLELRTDTPFFDRSYRLVTFDENDRESVLSQGRIVKQARNPRPARISFSASRSTASSW